MLIKFGEDGRTHFRVIVVTDSLTHAAPRPRARPLETGPITIDRAAKLTAQ